MVLVNESLGYRVCLECHDVFTDGDEDAWLARHIGHGGCQVSDRAGRRRGRPRPQRD